MRRIGEIIGRKEEEKEKIEDMKDEIDEIKSKDNEKRVEI